MRKPTSKIETRIENDNKDRSSYGHGIANLKIADIDKGAGTPQGSRERNCKQKTHHSRSNGVSEQVDNMMYWERK